MNKKNNYPTWGFMTLMMLGIAMGISQPANSQTSSPAETNSSTGNFTTYLPIANNEILWIAPFAIESNNSLASFSSLHQPMRNLGPYWVRLNQRISWRELQPQENGPIQWSLLTNFETELRSLRAAKVKPIIVVDDYPNWATIVPNSCSALKPDKYDDFANFVYALVQKYKDLNVKDWELGNEVDVDPRLINPNSEFGCWGDIDDLTYYGGDHYGEMVKVVGAAIKSADPTARVWIGGLMLASPNTTTPGHGKPENFLRGVLAVGAAPYFDVVPYHAHMLYYGVLKDPEAELAGPWLAWGGGLVGKANYLRQLMQEYGVTKTLSINEIGVGCRSDFSFCVPEPGPDFLDFQASMIVRLAVRAASVQADSFVWYTLNGPGWRNMGLMNGSTPRPSFYAYQTLINQTYTAAYLHPVNYGTGIEAYAFGNATTRVHVVWANPDGNIPFTVPQNVFISAADRDGNPIAPTVVGDNYQFIATFSPIYIKLSN